MTFKELFASDQWRVGLKFKAWDKVNINDSTYNDTDYSMHLVGTVNDIGGVCDDCSFPQNVRVEILVEEKS
jgi:hypothetical protein